MPSNTYLWLGCEDVDFPYPSAYGSTITVDTLGHSRSLYQRCALTANTAGYFRGTAFPGGAITSCWLHFYMFTLAGITANSLCLGLVNASTANSGLWLGVAVNGATQKLALYTFDGTTKVALVTDAVATFTASALTQVDIQLVNYGASAFVQVYLNQVPTLSFSGDTRIAGLTSLNAVCLGSSNVSAHISEIVVATGDTRYLPAMASINPSAAGTTANWTAGLFSDVNPATMSASLTYAYTNTVSQDQQFNMSDLTSFGAYAIGGVKAIATAAKSGGATPTNLKVGYNIGGTVNVGGSVAIGAGLTPVEKYDAINPVSGVDWTTANINGLQVDLQSA